MLGLVDALVRKSLVVAHHGAERTRYSLSRRSARSPTTSSTRPSGWSPPRPACRSLRGRGRGPLGTMERARLAGAGGLGRGGLANLRSAFGWARGREQLTVATDVAAHGALMVFSVSCSRRPDGRRRCSTGGRGRRTTPPAALRGRGLRLLRRPGRGGQGPCAPCRRAGGRPALRVVRARLREVHRGPREVYCGNLPRYVELTGEVAALPGRAAPSPSPPTSTACSRQAGSTRRSR